MNISRERFWQKVNFVPRISQLAMAKAWDEGKRYISYFAFPRCGKSYGAANLVAPYLLQHDWHLWIVAPTYELGSKEFGYIWNAYIESGLLTTASSRHYDKRGGNMTIEFPWGSFVKVISADNPSALRAEELDCIILAEASALTQDIFYNHLFARVEKRKGRVIVPTTPKGYNWVYDTFRVPSLQPGHKDLGGRINIKYDSAFWSAVVSAVPEYGDILEPNIYDEETIERARRTMPLPFFKEQFGGDFSSYAGLIYPWDPRSMYVDPFPVPNEWIHIIGWDHGARDVNPTAIMFGSYDPKGILYWWGEIYKGNRSISEYWHECQHVLGGKIPQFISSDPSAKQVRIELISMGVGPNTFPQDKDINARIIRMTQMMREGRMKVFRGCCPNFVREMQSWEWDEKNPGKPRPNQSCHALDGGGYAILIPVSLDTIEPLPTNEPPEITTLWKGVRSRFKEIEKEQDRKEMSDVFDNPFDEGLTVDEYDFYGSAHIGDVRNVG